jgi:hypothetical protein
MIAFTALQVTAVCTGTLRVKKGPHLLLNDDFLERLEDGFAFGEREAQGGRGQLLALQTADFVCFGLPFVGGDHDLDRVLHGDVPFG